VKFKLENTFGQTSAKKYLDKLIEDKKFIEIKEITAGTGEQNRYFHLILGWFAFSYGESLEYVKQIMIKQELCPEIFKVEFKEKKLIYERYCYFKSWSELTKKERTIVIDKFRNYASKEADIYLPSPDEQGLLESLEIELDKNKQWI
jgi:hypothetical protein